MVHNRVSGVLGVLGRHEGGGRALSSCREWLGGVWSEAGAGGLCVSRGSVGAVVAVPRAGLAGFLLHLCFPAPLLPSQRNVWLQGLINELCAR